jgi:glycosyltransferase involved in cell wall biosynthesis
MDETLAGNPRPELSIVVPALNEEDNVAPLIQEVRAAVIDAGIDAELIVVDDGSTDGTLDRLKALQSQYGWVRVLHRSNPMGQSAAFYAGIEASRGRYVATLDADLQNDPADLPKLLEHVRANRADMVQGVRERRRDNLKRKFSSWVGRTTRRLILGDTIYDTGCSTRVIRAEIARRFPLQYKGVHRFLPFYARVLGARVMEAPVNHRARHAGVAKYGMLDRAFGGLIDCFALRWMRKRLRSTACETVGSTKGLSRPAEVMR